AVFDISYQGRKYNLQTGYQENFHKSISLGTLHFGYQIEAAFRDPDVAFYDFMAGKGKNSDYKKSLANCSDEFARSEEHTSELQSRENLVCRLLLEKKNNKILKY